MNILIFNEYNVTSQYNSYSYATLGNYKRYLYQ